MAADSPVRRPAGREWTRRPLNRRPKQLDTEPQLFESASRGGGSGFALRGRRDDSPARAARGSGDTTMTDEDADLLAGTATQAIDPEVVRIARRIGSHLIVPRARGRVSTQHGVGAMTSRRYRGSSDDIDLDATLDRLVENPVIDDDNIVVREPRHTRRAVVLAIDISGSMRGERARTAAATVGALCSELRRDDLAVIAFWSDAALLVPLGGRRPPSLQVVARLLGLPARGLTNVAFPLEIAAGQLARVPSRDARVVLLSDCVHNAGPDPRDFAAALPRVDVLLDTSGENDLDLARDLAGIGRGRLALARRHQDVGPALSHLFAL